jgi:hypothetical protein
MLSAQSEEPIVEGEPIPSDELVGRVFRSREQRVREVSAYLRPRRTHNFGPNGQPRPGETAVRTAVPGGSMVRMCSSLAPGRFACRSDDFRRCDPLRSGREVRWPPGLIGGRRGTGGHGWPEHAQRPWLWCNDRSWFATSSRPPASARFRCHLRPASLWRRHVGADGGACVVGRRPGLGRKRSGRYRTRSWARCGRPRRAEGGPIECPSRARRYRSSAWAVLRPIGSARGRRPLPSTQTMRWSRSMSSRVMPTHSARRMPVSTSSRMTAVSRRLVKSRPSQVLSSRARCSGRTASTGCSAAAAASCRPSG